MSLSLDNDMIADIVTKYSDMLMRICFQYTHSLREAEDILQDTFLALVEKRRFTSEDIRYWLIRVAINKCKNFLKSSARKILSLDDVNLAFTPKELETFEELDRLPDTDRNILYLHYYEGYSVKEIGKILKLTQNAVCVRMTRSRQKLKRLIEENGEE